MDKLGCITLILKGIIEESVAHTNLALLPLFHINEVLKLLEPHPVIDIHSLQDRVLQKLLNNVNVVNNVENEGFHLLE